MLTLIFSWSPGDSASQADLTEQIRSGRLRPMLELGVTPSHVSIAVVDERDGEGGEEREGEVYCIPLESLGLGGNQITDTGAKVLAESLTSNTSELTIITVTTTS